MADGNLLQSAFVYLSATIVSVPIAKRLGLGSVLGYLMAGAIIGPFALNLVGASESVMHTAEFGVVIMLFLIGLELQPALLWKMRVAIMGMGGLQVVATGALGMACAMLFGLAWQMALAVGATLSLSSTAIVLQSLREKGIAATDAGRGAFSVLLFQDIAIIPMLALFPLLATLAPVGVAAASGPLDGLAPWIRGLAVFAAIGLIILSGRILLRPLFRWIAATGLHEVFTAFALFLVVGVALLMQSVGLSPALGAFVAGVVLADSEFRHEIETDIEPFRGLLLGLFFISVGAGVDFALLTAQPFAIFGLVLLLIAVKAALMFAVAKAFGQRSGDAALIALGLAQGGEFGFVLFAFATSAGILPGEVTKPLVLVVAISMALTPLLLMAGQAIMAQIEKSSTTSRPHEIEDDHAEVIIAGYGRFGQVVGRFLGANGFKISVLEHDAEQVELLRGFGRKVNYGDATRLDLLRLAGADEARLLVVAIDNPEKALALVETARNAFPDLKIIARAFDRRQVYELRKRNVDGVERETFSAGVRLGVKAMRLLGRPAYKSERAGKVFTRYDETILDDMYAHWLSEPFAGYQRIVRDRTALEEDLLRRDLSAVMGAAQDATWDEETADREAFERALADKGAADTPKKS